ncbi:hypothetical protein [Polaribacter sp. IC073]|uniref:hypothetical protein n=1 Tax=Polaribacter sp. IC073 TaxID=2508540 RepID=UPI0011BE0AA2|nr:hypothetical protein [Polaribacter sp. IC073]TXD49198.1 hypothetical protein ES045_03790 [Polaribacter sp. IC073]
MIDLLKYYVINKDKFVTTLENSEKVDLRLSVNSRTAEVLDKRTAHFNKTIFIDVTKNNASLKGSIHKYYNVTEEFGNQNYNDFSYCNYKYAINHLQNSFSIDNDDTRITNLEFGLNIETKEDPEKLINNHILMYDYKTPTIDEKFRGKGDYLEFKTTDYSIKIYNKSKQNAITDKNILRIELKITGARYLKKHFNIYTLNDLDRNRFQLLFNKLLEHFNKLLIVDELILTKHDRIDETMLFQQGTNSNYWKEIRQNARNKLKFKNDFENLLKANCLLKTKNQLKFLLNDKFKEMMNCDLEILKYIA